VDLWARSGILQAHKQTDQQQQQQQQQQQEQQQLPGRYFVPVSLWPCAKLPRGVALISSSVWSGLVQPDQGAYLALYALQQPAATGEFLSTIHVDIEAFTPTLMFAPHLIMMVCCMVTQHVVA
jgi:hypothetical protein